MEAAIAVIARPSLLLVSRLTRVRGTMAKRSLIEHLAMVPRTRDKRETNKRDGLGMTAMAASMHSSRERFGDRKSRKETGLYLVPSHRKFDYSRVICVFLL